MNLKLPNLFILGPEKTGSTSLVYWLSQHEDIFVPVIKEPLFFEAEYENGPAFYSHKYFRRHEDQSIIVDARAMNSVVQYVAPRIAETCPLAQLIIIHRDPLARAFSNWNHYASMRPGRSFKTFNEALNSNLKSVSYSKFTYEHEYIPYRDSRGGCYIPYFIEASLYGNMLSNYLKHFSAKQITIVDFESLTKDPVNTYASIIDSIGVERVYDINFSKKNIYAKKSETPTRGEILGLLSKPNAELICEMFDNDQIFFHRQIVDNDILTIGGSLWN